VTGLDEQAKPFISQVDVRLHGAHAKRVVSLRAENVAWIPVDENGADLARSIGDTGSKTPKSIPTREISSGIGRIAGRPA